MGLCHLLLSFVVKQGFPGDICKGLGIPTASRLVSPAQGFSLTLQED